MIRRPKVRLALTESDLLERLHRALESADVEVEILPTDGERPEHLGSADADVVIVAPTVLSEPLGRADARLGNGHGRNRQLPGHVDGDHANGRASTAPGTGPDSDAAEDDAVRRMVPLHLCATDGEPPLPGADEIEPQLSSVYLQGDAVRSFLEGLRDGRDTPVLAVCETGLGASELARAIHAGSGRSGRNYVVLAGGSGADEAVRALVRAEGGTLFVDDLHHASHDAQRVLLAAVRDRALLHSTNPGPCNVRVVAAAHPSLDALVEAGKFDRELVGILSTNRLDVPPLRTRTSEIRTLADAIVRHFRNDLNRPEVRGFDADSMRVLESYAWPGNLSELIHIVEQSIVATAGTVVRTECIPSELHQRLSTTSSYAASEQMLPNGWEIMSLKEVREAATAQIERIFLDRLLARTTGRVGETARLAGISPRALYDRMRKHDLRKEDYKRSRGR